jgi:UPF0755 protein
MTDGSGNWSYRGRFGADDLGADDFDADDFGVGDFGADDPRPDDDFYSGSYSGTGRAEGSGYDYSATGRAERPGYDPEGVSSGWSGQFERPGYGRSGPTERPGDPYYQPRPGDSGRYDQPGGYDDEPGRPDEAGGYGGSSGYGDVGGFGSASSHGRPGQLSSRDDLGGYGAGLDSQDSYAAGPPYASEAYQSDDAYGPGGYDGTGSLDRYGDDPYGDRPYGDVDSYPPDPGRTSSAYDWQGQRSGGDSPPSQQYGRAPAGGGADTGSFARGDSGSFARGDSGSFARGDSGSFGRPGTGRDNLGRGEDLPPSRGPLPGSADGYALWQSGPMERVGWGHGGGQQDGDDWGDDDEPDDDGGPVSRFFGRGGHGDDERDDDERGGRRSRRGRLATVAAILAGALVLGMVADFAFEYANHWINHRYGDYSGSGYGTVRVTVPQGASLTGLGPMLLSDNVIEAVRPYDSAANAVTNPSSLQPGVYLLHNHMNAALAVAALLNPKNRVNDQVTIIEGWRATEIAGVLAKATGDPVKQFMQIINNPPASLGLPKWAPAGKSAEGFLFPDTYTLLPHESPLKILQTMVQDFNRRIASLHLPALAKQKFTTPYHALIVASLIQAEAGSVGDFEKISRVIWDRLKNRMQLQFDSTVFYAMGKYGTAITKAQESYPSPYNTYRHAGLPPGPIGSPSLLAIQAALHPVEGQTWLYFITDTRHKPFKTYFTSSLLQLQRWQQQFQG